jgi:hypothetical protein
MRDNGPELLEPLPRVEQHTYSPRRRWVEIASTGGQAVPDGGGDAEEIGFA